MSNRRKMHITIITAHDTVGFMFSIEHERLEALIAQSGQIVLEIMHTRYAGDEFVDSFDIGEEEVFNAIISGGHYASQSTRPISYDAFHSINEALRSGIYGETREVSMRN